MRSRGLSVEISAADALGTRDQKRNEWVSVSEIVPEVNEIVLAWDGGVFVAEHTGDGRFFTHDRDYEAITSVTHWRPLPEPPRESE